MLLTLRNHNHCGTHATVKANALQCQVMKSKEKSAIYKYIYATYIHLCYGWIRAEEVLDEARPKKANKKEEAEKQSKHKNNKQTFYGCHCRKLGLGLGVRFGGGSSVLGGFVFVSLCLAVKCFDAYGLSNAGDTNRQKQRHSLFHSHSLPLSLSLILCHFLFV